MGCPCKPTGKENQGVPISPLGGEINSASLSPSSDEPAEEGTQTSMADENHILRERLAKVEANLAAAEATEHKRKRQENEEAICAAAEKITTLVRPKGEAGNAKGFNLQEAMGLNASGDKAVLYNEIMRELQIQVQVAKLNPRLHFAQQDAEKLGHIYQKMHKTFEWLDNQCFPGDWAVADMIKQYLHGQRKKITRDDKIKKEAEDEQQAKEHHRCQAILQKWTVLAEDDLESLAIEATNEGTMADEEDENWPPVHPNKKSCTSPATGESSELSEEESN